MCVCVYVCVCVCMCVTSFTKPYADSEKFEKVCMSAGSQLILLEVAAGLAYVSQLAIEESGLDLAIIAYYFTQSATCGLERMERHLCGLNSKGSWSMHKPSWTVEVMTLVSLQ